MGAWSEHTRFAIGLFALITPLPVLRRLFGLLVIAIGVEVAVRGVRAHAESFLGAVS